MHRVWYARDLAGMAAADHITLSQAVLVEADSSPNPGGLPKGGQTVVSFRNEHLSYAVTWFGLFGTAGTPHDVFAVSTEALIGAIPGAEVTAVS